MEKIKKNELFKDLEVPASLTAEILSRIDILEKRALRIAFFLSSGLAALSAIFLFFAGRSLYNDLNQSGFISSFHLIFTDSPLVFSYWQDFTGMLLESLPVISLTAFFSAALVFIFSIGYISRYRSRHNHRKIFKTNFA